MDLVDRIFRLYFLTTEWRNKIKRIKIGLGVGIIVLISSLTLFGCSNETKKEGVKDVAVESEENNDNGEGINNSEKEYVSNADYTYGNLKGKVYKSNVEDKELSIEDLVMPYIMLESNDAQKANDEIKQLYDELAKKVEDRLNTKEEEPDIDYIISKYETTMNDNVLSILITTEEWSGDSCCEYYSYNFDINTGKRLLYKDLYEKVGFTNENIDSKVNNVLKNMFADVSDDNFGEDDTREQYEKANYKNYQTVKANGKLVYFLDKNGKLNIIVATETPLGRGGDPYDTFIIE